AVRAFGDIEPGEGEYFFRRRSLGDTRRRCFSLSSNDAAAAASAAASSFLYCSIIASCCGVCGVRLRRTNELNSSGRAGNGRGMCLSVRALAVCLSVVLFLVVDVTV
ncbi:hypothetical protein PMAYCL1PPCAC_32337, partial [Pristionchus mayeri]